MITIGQLNEKVDAVIAAAEAEKQQFLQVIDGKNQVIDQLTISNAQKDTRIAELEAQVANGPQIPDEIGTKLDNAVTKIGDIVPQ